MWREMSDQSTRDEVLLANRALLVLHSSRSAAHELNNVFQMIGGAAELLLANAALAPSLIPRVESVMRHGRRGEAIVRSLADLARPEGPGPSVLDLADCSHQALEMRRFEHRRAGITVAADLQPGITVRGDARDLVQILLNVILCAEHAVDGGDGDPAITLSFEPQGENVDLVVANNGTGDGAAAFDLRAARLLAESAGGRLDRVGNVTRLRLPVGRSLDGHVGQP